MIEKQTIGRDFGAAAAEYDANAHLQKQVREHCTAIAQEIFSDGAAILDVGSGTGAFAAESKQWKITQLDLAFGMCEFATKHGAVANADAMAMPFSDNSFDGVFSSLMLQWAQPKPVLQEILRILKPGARAVISTLTKGTLKELQESFADIDGAPHVSDFLSAPEIVGHSVHVGFTALSVEEVTVVEYHPDAMSLMRSLKVIGAANKQPDRRKGLTTPEQMEQVEKHYKKRFSTRKGLPATWKILYLILEKK